MHRGYIEVTHFARGGNWTTPQLLICMLDIILRIGHHATGEDALDDRAISGWVQSAMKKLRALRRDRQKVTGDEVSEAMVKAGTADGTWIGAVTMVAGIAWNWVWHRHRRGA